MAHKLWDNEGLIEVIGNDIGFIFFKFANKEWRDKVMEKGPRHTVAKNKGKAVVEECSNAGHTVVDLAVGVQPSVSEPASSVTSLGPIHTKDSRVPTEERF